MTAPSSTLSRPATLTESILTDMLTENTGSHMLDSGGAYGRNWERNQGLTVEAFRSADDATIDQWGCIYLNLFHWLEQRLKYEPVMDTAFHEWANEGEQADQPWLQSAHDWADLYTGTPNVGSSYNSYNGECFLSQTIQWVEFNATDNDGWDQHYVMLQIHGGADVRGGYTSARVFVLDDGLDFFGHDMADAVVHCAGRETETVLIGQILTDGTTVTTQPMAYHSWDMRVGIVESYRETRINVDGTMIDSGDEYSPENWGKVALETDDDDNALCPECDAVLSVEAPYAS